MMRFRDIPVLTDGQVARFWLKVDQSGGPDACWPWLASCRSGYGQFRVRPWGMFLSHRVVYQLVYGDLSADLLVCHECDNPPCCNFAHLFQGTDGDNVRDMLIKGRRVFSLAERAAISERMKSRVVSPATRAAMSEALKARFASPEARAALSERGKMQFASAAARAVVSERSKARFASPSVRLAASQSAKARLRSPDGRRFAKRGGDNDAS